jgi:hypothetical protein
MVLESESYGVMRKCHGVTSNGYGVTSNDYGVTSRIIRALSGAAPPKASSSPYLDSATVQQPWNSSGTTE